jgi:hypothetical protein
MDAGEGKGIDKGRRRGRGYRREGKGIYKGGRIGQR